MKVTNGASNDKEVSQETLNRYQVRIQGAAPGDGR
jgi:hypothetical protein